MSGRGSKGKRWKATRAAHYGPRDHNTKTGVNHGTGRHRNDPVIEIDADAEAEAVEIREPEPR